MNLEVYQEVFRITRWDEDTVLETTSEGHDWFPLDTVNLNRPHETNVIYASPSDGRELVWVRRRP